MNQINFSALLSFIIFTALGITIQADVVVLYDNGAGGASNIDNAFASDPDFPVIQADDFAFGVSETFDRITWTGAYAFDNTPPALDNFTFNIFLDDGTGTPQTTPDSTFNVGSSVNRTDSGQDLFGFDVYEYSADFVGFTPNAGQTYWLSISNDTTGEADNWFWGVIQNGSNSFSSTDGGATWVSQNNQHDFQLINIPEPNSITLLILGISLVATRRRSRRK